MTRLLSEQGIINNVYDPTSQALRTTTNLVLSGVELSLNSAVEIKDATTDTRVKVKTDGTDNGMVVIQNTQPLPTGAATEATLGIISARVASPVVVQGNSTGAPWVISGLTVLDSISIKNSDRARLSNQNTTITNSTTETTIVTAGASGVFNDIVSFVITNRNLDSGVTVTIRDATAGTARMTPFLAPTGGAVFTPVVPVLQTTAANNWTAQLSHSSSIVDIFAHFAKNV